MHAGKCDGRKTTITFSVEMYVIHREIYVIVHDERAGHVRNTSFIGGTQFVISDTPPALYHELSQEPVAMFHFNLTFSLIDAGTVPD